MPTTQPAPVRPSSLQVAASFQRLAEHAVARLALLEAEAARPLLFLAALFGATAHRACQIAFCRYAILILEELADIFHILAEEQAEAPPALAPPAPPHPRPHRAPPQTPHPPHPPRKAPAPRKPRPPSGLPGPHSAPAITRHPPPHPGLPAPCAAGA